MVQAQAPLLSRNRFDGREDGDPCRLLALALFLQAFHDLEAGCPAARAWLFAPENGDLQFWADVAELSISRIRRRAKPNPGLRHRGGSTGGIQMRHTLHFGGGVPINCA